MQKSQPSSPPATDPPPRILIVKLGALGDIVMAFTAFARVRATYPQSHITLLTRLAYADFLQNCPWIDSIITDSTPKFYDIPALLKLHKRIRDGDFSLIYDLQKSSRSRRYLMRLQGLKADIADTIADEADTKAWLKRGKIDNFAIRRPYILLFPGCAPHRAVKRWRGDNYAQLATLLHQRGYQPIIIGSDFEKPIATTILHICPAALDLTAATDILQIATLASSAAGAVGNDTGPLHLAVHMQCPSLILCGPDSSSQLYQTAHPDGKIGSKIHNQIYNSKILRCENLQHLSLDKVAKNLPFG